MTTCTHGMPSPASCVDCMYEGNVEPPPRPEPERAGITAVARFDSQCPACNLPILNGQVVVHTSRDRWLHEGCSP